MNKYLLDTCALIWWTLDQEKLSSKAFEACQKIEQNTGYVSSISIWEIGIKIKNRKLNIGMTIETYVKNLHKLGYLNIIPVDDKIFLKNLSLAWKHKDPADRTIVATAHINNFNLITSDKIIKKFYKKTYW
jgi:PIN domain nuclease of toxin-antitoxin system